MKQYLQHLVRDLNNLSKSLDKKSILIDKPWALVDSDFEIQKLIFKKNKELILSKDGKVILGKWDYFPEAKSLLIDRGEDKILCREAFIDEAVLVLKMDGTKDNFFVLANENLIPDLDAYKYLKELKYKYFNIRPLELIDGRMLEIFCGDDYFNEIGKKVSFESEEVDDGIYKINKSRCKYLIKNSSVIAILVDEILQTKDGYEIMIERNYSATFKKGDNVWINGNPAPDGKYNLKGASNIIVKDGKVFKKSLF